MRKTRRKKARKGQKIMNSHLNCFVSCPQYYLTENSHELHMENKKYKLDAKPRRAYAYLYFRDYVKIPSLIPTL